MSVSDLERWNTKYTRVAPPAGVTADAWLLEQVAGLVPGRALELACGLGHNAIALARLGWQVDAVDISPVGLELAAELARSAGVSVDWIAADLDQFVPAAQAYDLVILDLRGGRRHSRIVVVEEGLRRVGQHLHVDLGRLHVLQALLDVEAAARQRTIGCSRDRPLVDILLDLLERRPHLRRRLVEEIHGLLGADMRVAIDRERIRHFHSPFNVMAGICPGHRFSCFRMSSLKQEADRAQDPQLLGVENRPALVNLESCVGTLELVAVAADELARRLCGLFLPDESGRRPCHGDDPRYHFDPHWKDLILFYEYFDGDNGRGLGASHQTGWTALAVRALGQVIQSRQ